MNSLDSEICSQVIEILENVTQKRSRPIALHEPQFDQLEVEFVTSAINSTYVSSFGEYITRFEQEIGKITGSNYVIATSSGTAALEVALAAVGVKPKTEVMVPTLSFVASANAVANIGAIPYFVDSESNSLGLDPEKLSKLLSTLKYDSRIGKFVNPDSNNVISAIMPMHALGHPCQIELIEEIANQFNIPVVEDAAEALGSYVIVNHDEVKHCGTFGKIGALSFNGNKIVTTGAGGAILTDDENLAILARKLSNTAKIPHPWEFKHEMISHNYRLPNLNASLGLAQISKLETFLQKKRSIAMTYAQLFSNHKDIEFLYEPNGTISNYWLSSIRLSKSNSDLRDIILNEAFKREIFLRPIWNLIHSQPMYKNCPTGDLSESIAIQKSVLCLPSSANLLD